MKLNLEWLKKHKLAAGAAVLVGLLVLFVLFRKSGSSGGITSLAANQQQGQLQLAELNAQEGSQQDQLNTQLAASEYQTQAQQQANQDQLAASIASAALPYQFEQPLYEQELTNQGAEQEALIPLEEELVGYGTSGKAHGSLIGLTQNELELLTGETSGQVPSLGAPYESQGSGSGFSISLPGGIGIGTQLGTGLFG